MGVAPTHGIARQVSYWKDQLKDHPDKDFAQRLCNYVEFGIPIEFEGECNNNELKNWPSSEQFKEQVNQFVEKHYAEGAIEGPFELGTDVVKTSPIGAFMKKGKDKVRVIHDLSYPHGNSINSGISKENSTVSYSSVLDAVALCKLYRTPFMAKYDLQDAFLSCPVRLEDRKYLGFLWENSEKSQIMRFSSLPFGLRTSARKFSELAQGLMYICKKNGASGTSIFYLDDALTVSGTEADCKESIDIMCSTAERCGFKVNPKKTKGPSRVIEFLGIELNSISGQMKITQERLQEIRSELNEWLGRKTCTKRELLSILGKLQFCSKVVIHGNKFMRRIIELSKRGKRLNSKIRLSKEARKDFSWWAKCMGCHNGIGWFEKSFDAKNAVLIFTDASDIAMGGVVGNKWTHIAFEGQYHWMLNKTIPWKELAAIVMTLATFGPILRNKHVLMHVDNEGIQVAIEKGSSKIEDIMKLVRVLYFYCGIYNITYKAVHISTHLNSSADAISRHKWELFFQINPGADKRKTHSVDFLTDF